jgi:hypothetical protein
MPLRPTIAPKKSLVPKKIVSKKTAPAPIAKKQQPKAATFSARPTLPPKGMLRCTSCGAVYYDKHWHSPSLVAADVPKSEMVEAMCDACHGASSASANAGWAGEVTLEGVPPANREDVLSQVRAIAKRALVRDPEERIIRILEKAGRIIVTTTENQLAVAIGTEVHAAHKGGTLSITWSDDDKPVRVTWAARS